MINKKVVLATRPDGPPKETDFKIIEEDIAELGPDQVLLQTEHLSIDAFIRTTLDGDPGLHGTMNLNTPVVALGVARVVDSRSEDLKQGDRVFGPLGAQTHVLGAGNMYRKLTDESIPARRG